MNAKRYRLITLTTLLLGILCVTIPPFLFHHNPDPKAGFIGCYGIPIFKNPDGTMHYIFWIDFAIAALLFWAVSLTYYCKRKKLNR